MSKLLWDQVGERFYEAGLDRGVLYLSDSSGVAWSGLTSVEEDFGGDSTSPTYFDGVKTRDTPSIGDFSATLTALTYPDEFLEYEGSGSFGNGLLVDNQSPKLFGLSYRSLVGNDIDGSEHGYKIHILYNLTATPESVGNETLNDSPSPANFSWRLSSVPMEARNYRPTAHVIFDSRDLEESMLNGIEDILYGASQSTARLPTINDLVDLVASWDPRLIVPDTVAGLAELDPGMGDLTPSTIEGLYTSLPDTRLVVSSTPGLYTLDES